MSKERINSVMIALRFIIFAILVIFILFWSMNCCIRKFVYPLEYKKEVLESSSRYNLDSALVFAVIKVESNFDSDATSGAGAVGLMQITPSTAEYISKLVNKKDYDLFNAADNIEFGCFYLNYLLAKFGNLQTALYAYNAGEGKVAGWLKDKKYSLDGTTLFNVPYKETKEYTEKISETFSKYKKLYGNILDKR